MTQPKKPKQLFPLEQNKDLKIISHRKAAK